MLTFVFSGQGSQKEQMGQELVWASPPARQLYEKTERLLGYAVHGLSNRDLAQSVYAQPAIVTFSLALWDTLKAHYQEQAAGPWPADRWAYAGFSLGEYTALAASEVLAWPDLIRLVHKRAQWMQEAAQRQPGAMAAVVGLDLEQLREIVQEPAWRGRVFIANENAPGQTVLSGEADLLPACCERCLQAGAKRIFPLAVQGACHTPLMQEAADRLQDYAQTLTFERPRGLLFSNLTGQPLGPNWDWPQHLARHLCQPVRWIDQVRAMAGHQVTCFYELGPDPTLSRLIKRIHPQADTRLLQEAASVARAVQTLGSGPAR